MKSYVKAYYLRALIESIIYVILALIMITLAIWAGLFVESSSLKGVSTAFFASGVPLGLAGFFTYSRAVKGRVLIKKENAESNKKWSESDLARVTRWEKITRQLNTLFILLSAASVICFLGELIFGPKLFIRGLCVGFFVSLGLLALLANLASKRHLSYLRHLRLE